MGFLKYKDLYEQCPDLVREIVRRNNKSGWGPQTEEKARVSNNSISDSFTWHSSKEGQIFWSYLNHNGFKKWLTFYPDALEIVGVKKLSPKERAVKLSQTINIKI